MVTYSVEAITAILAPVPAITGRPSFKGLWDVHKRLVTCLRKIKHPDHPHQGMAGSMMTPESFALVSNTPWASAACMGEFFRVPMTAITETDQRTAECEWIAMRLRETNEENLATCLVTMFERVIPLVYHTGGNEIGRGGFGTLAPLEI